jgi:hypothetical protein
MPIAAVGPRDPTTNSETPPGPAPDTQGRAAFVQATEVVTDYHCEYTAALEGQLAEARVFLSKVQEVLSRRFPRCHDCADFDGTCPSSGLPCDLWSAFGNVRAALTSAAQVRAERDEDSNANGGTE